MILPTICHDNAILKQNVKRLVTREERTEHEALFWISKIVTESLMW